MNGTTTGANRERPFYFLLVKPKNPSTPPTVLHLSLRDICVNVSLASQNIVDDVDHCLKGKTSLHLTEMALGDRDFVAGSLVDVMEKKFKPDHYRPRTFSPFGLDVLDLAVGNFVFEAAKSSSSAIVVPDFFSNSPDGEEGVRLNSTRNLLRST